MNTRTKFGTLLLSIAILSGCATVDVTKTAKGFYDKTDPNEVEILKTRPDRAYIELATVTATGFKPIETAKMHNAIRSKSAVFGANAVILTEEGVLPNGKKWSTGVALRWK